MPVRVLPLPLPALLELIMHSRCDVIVDAFCGAGGNAIQFAMTCAKGESRSLRTALSALTPTERSDCD